MSLSVKIVTLPYLPAAEDFDQAALEALARQSEILAVMPAFFEYGGRPHWSLVITHRLLVAPGEQPARVEPQRAAQPSAAGSGSASPAPPSVAEPDWGLYQCAVSD
jgi:hypothetical protein